jgi:hypothetical protein
LETAVLELLFDHLLELAANPLEIDTLLQLLPLPYCCSPTLSSLFLDALARGGVASRRQTERSVCALSAGLQCFQRLVD